MGPPLQYPIIVPITYGYHFVIRLIIDNVLLSIPRNVRRRRGAPACAPKYTKNVDMFFAKGNNKTP